jgi:hypothetical protein
MELRKPEFTVASKSAPVIRVEISGGVGGGQLSF